MIWYETVVSVHTAVTDKVSHCRRLKSDRYFVWEEDGANDLSADDRHIERAITGTTDLFTKMEFDPWVHELEVALDNEPTIAWRYNSFQYEEDTGFYHHEWEWQVVENGSY